MSWTIGILGLALLVLIHEAGHFFVARAVGMNPRKFYVGFPPALVKVRRKGTEYGIGAIPLGGYVKIPGMHRPAGVDLARWFGPAQAEYEPLTWRVAAIGRLLDTGQLSAARAALDDLEHELKEVELTPAARRLFDRGIVDLRDGLGPDAYWRQRTWKRVAVIFAGPGINLLFAIGLLATIFMLGLPEGETTTVASVQRNSPAEEAGLERGDRIVAVDGVPTPTFDGVREAIRLSGGDPVVVTVVREGEQVRLRPATPELREERYVIGFTSEPQRYRTFGPVESVQLAGEVTWAVTVAIVQSLGRVVTGEGRDEVSSVVGIADISSQAVEEGVRRYLEVLALISLSLALLNLLPLLPLDGGHILFSLIEGVRGRAVGRAVYERFSLVGFALVLLLFAIGLRNDIGR